LHHDIDTMAARFGSISGRLHPLGAALAVIKQKGGGITCEKQQPWNKRRLLSEADRRFPDDTQPMGAETSDHEIALPLNWRPLIAARQTPAAWKIISHLMALA
jgi:hypothetical protein